MVVSSPRRTLVRPAHPVHAALGPLRRRRVVGAALLGSVPRIAGAQGLPAHPVRILFGFPAGSTPDVILRVLAERMAARLGQPVVVENRPGAVGAIAGEAAARATPDGTTLLFMPQGHLVLSALRPDLPFDPLADFVDVAGIVAAPLVLVADPGLGLRDASSLVELGRARGDRLAYGMSGIGANPHLAMAMFARRTGIAPTAVPFRGDPEIFTALLSRQVGMAFALAPTAIPLVRDDRLQALGVTAAQRMPALPDVPTMAESGWPEVTLSSWWALVAPARTAPPALQLLRSAARAALTAPEFQDRMAASGAQVVDLGPDGFAPFALAERSRLLGLYRELGLTAG